MLRNSSLPLGLKLLRRTETVVSLALANQLLRPLCVKLCSLRLPIRTVRPTLLRPLIKLNSKPRQIFQQLRFESRFAAGDVGVFDAQDVGAPMLAGEEVVEEGGAGVADVEVSRG